MNNRSADLPENLDLPASPGVAGAFAPACTEASGYRWFWVCRGLRLGGFVSVRALTGTHVCKAEGRSPRRF